MTILVGTHPLTGFTDIHSGIKLNHTLSALSFESATRRDALINKSNSWENRERIKRATVYSTEDVIQIRIQLQHLLQ